MNLVLSPEQQEQYFRMLENAKDWNRLADKYIRELIIQQKGEEFERSKQ